MHCSAMQSSAGRPQQAFFSGSVQPELSLSLYPLLNPCHSRVSPVSFMKAPMPALMVADSIQNPRHTAINTAQLSLSLPTEAAVTPWGAMLTTVSRG